METILSISGKPGLYRLVSRGNQTLIVETLDSKRRRMPAFASDQVTSLADIAIYTQGDDMPLWRVLAKVGEKENSAKCSIDWKKGKGEDIRAYMAEVLPEYDQERVRDNHIRKLLQWYDTLVECGITDFAGTLSPTEGDNVDDRQNQ